MTQRQYDADTAQTLMKLAYQEYEDEAHTPYVERDDGMHADKSFRAASPPGTAYDWTPADEMDWPGSPNPNTAPFLPIPFTASELAACMLDGPGQSIQFALDRRIGYSLDDGALGSIRASHRWMRDALEEAYALAAAAQLVVGEFDYDEEARAHTLAQQYDDANGQANDREGVFEQGITPEEASARRARAVTSVADLKVQARRAQSTVASKWKAWRKAMVRELLQPQKDADAALQAAPTANTVNAPVKARRNLLTPVIEAAQKNCVNPLDPPDVWASLVLMAGTGKLPLLGVSDEGIKWQDANDEPQFLTLKNLSDRLRRSKKKHSEAR